MFSEKERNTYFYYVNEESQIVYYIEEDKNKLLEMTPKEKSKMDHRFFEVNQNYEGSLEGLKLYEKDFNRCNEEIIKYTKGRTDYKKWFNDGLAIMACFKSKSTNIFKKLNIENIDIMECVTFEKCYCAGITYMDKEYINKPTKCYGYDFSNCYGTFLSKFDVSNLKIPIKQGKFEQLEELDIMKLDKLKYGIYHVEIRSSHPIVMKYFKISQDQWYCHFSLIQLKLIIEYILKKEKKTAYDDTIAIIQLVKTENNCLVWNKKDMVNCDVIFGDWFKYVNKLKQNLPNNMLVKNLTTKLWGYLTQYNRIFANRDEAKELDFDFYDGFTENKKFEYLCIKAKNIHKDCAKYELVDSSNPYKNGGIARLKPFLLASVRQYMTTIILNNGLDDNVIRLCTDGIVLNKQYDFSTSDFEYYPKPEDKTTGLIKFYHVNKYFHYCPKCKEEYKFCKKTPHYCV